MLPVNVSSETFNNLRRLQAKMGGQEYVSLADVIEFLLVQWTGDLPAPSNDGGHEL